MPERTTYPRLLASAEALTLALEARDAYTRHHCDRVVRLATELGNSCGVLDAELDSLRICARYHDIGKIGVPDAVLLKAGGLTDEEWTVMKAHSAMGERIFKAADLPDHDAIAQAIRHHHESFDGSGYPDGLEGEGIPLLSRILLVVDGYDGMTTSRPYQRARDHKSVMTTLATERGKKLDPQVFDTFARLIEHSPARAS